MADAIIEKQREYVAEQEEHQRHIAENYRKLLDSASPKTEERPAYHAPAPAPAPMPVSAPAAQPASNAAARIRDYNAYRVAEGQRTISGSAPTAANELVMSVPVAATKRAEVKSVRAEESEDARPTAATMAMLSRDEEAVIEAQQIGFFAALPTKLKVAFFVVMSAIIAAISIIFINTSVLRSMDNRIEAERATVQQLEQRAEEVRQSIRNATDPDAIAQWAEEHGMIKG